jgi:ferrous iron transport protein B
MDDIFVVEKKTPYDKIIALAGNPNVGKSTVFNALTGMNQHTGNWPGKTVANAQGVHRMGGVSYILVDLPGTYSLMAHSTEEEIARDFLLYGGADSAVVVCDATCLERNLNLVLQTLEITPTVAVCVNLLDEADKKGMVINLEALERELGVPVIGASARAGKGLEELMERVRVLTHSPRRRGVRQIAYPPAVEEAVALLTAAFAQQDVRGLPPRWLALRLLEGDAALQAKLWAYLDVDLTAVTAIAEALEEAARILEAAGLSPATLQDSIVSHIIKTAEEIAARVATRRPDSGRDRDRRLDRILTGKATGIPIMLALLGGILWLSISGANLPSQLLADGLFWIQDRLTELFFYVNAPDWLHGALVLGVYRVLAWVVSVMLPPMAIFFPLFTLLEDFGYLPRVAFNLDHQFRKANTCGKQALTMCMGFGCNAAGVTGCRIIDSPRERLIAMITNSFVPCNGRFPP